MIGSTTNSAEYAGNASTVTAYVIPFRYDAAGWVVVTVADAAGVVTDLEQVTDYTLAGDGATSDGEFTTVVAIPATSTVKVYREAPGTQTLDLEPNTPLPATSLEGQLDRLAMAVMDRVSLRAMEARIRDIELTPLQLDSTPGSTDQVVITGTQSPDVTGTYPLYSANEYRSATHRCFYQISFPGGSWIIKPIGAGLTIFSSDDVASPDLATWTAGAGVTGTPLVEVFTSTPGTLGQLAIVSGTAVYICTATSPMTWVQLSN